MSTVAEQLRLAREAQHLTLHQVAEITKIKTDHLRALEAGDYDCFIAPVYIRGFVRSYANLLKLDVPRLSADLDGELSKSPKFREPPPLSPRPRTPLDLLMFQLTRMNWRIALAVLALVVVAVLAVAGFRGKNKEQDTEYLKKLGPGLYTPRPDPTGETLPLPTVPLRRP